MSKKEPIQPEPRQNQSDSYKEDQENHHYGDSSSMITAHKSRENHQDHSDHSEGDNHDYQNHSSPKPSDSHFQSSDNYHGDGSHHGGGHQGYQGENHDYHNASGGFASCCPL